jgi:hypothetical protein
LICDVIKCATGTRNEWITDKSGVKITEIIINPTMNLLYNMLNMYLNETINYDVDNLTIEEVMKITNNRQITSEIMKEIKDNILHKEVLKYITPFLSADLTKIEEAINKSIYDEFDTSSDSIPAKKSNKKVNRNYTDIDSVTSSESPKIYRRTKKRNNYK